MEKHKSTKTVTVPWRSIDTLQILKNIIYSYAREKADSITMH